MSVLEEDERFMHWLTRAKFRQMKSIDRLSKSSGISVNRILAWESGEALPNVASQRKLASGLGIGLEEVQQALAEHHANVDKCRKRMADIKSASAQLGYGATGVSK